MKNYLILRKKITATLIFSLVIVLVYFLLMLVDNQIFSVEVIIGVIKPIAVLGTMMILISFVFLFFPEAIFKSWLKRIAWWYSLGLFLVTASTPVLSSNVLSLDRSQIVFGGMILLVIITVPFIYVTHRRLKKVS
jgi:hypothetical protein